MIASNNLFVKGLTRFLPNGRVFGVGGRNDINWSLTLSLYVILRHQGCRENPKPCSMTLSALIKPYC